MAMNRQWMRERLESFKTSARYEDECRRTADSTDTMRAISDQLAYQIPTVREILKRLGPTLAQEVTEPQYLGGASDSLRAGQQGLGILGDQDEWAANSPRTRPRSSPTSSTRTSGRPRRPDGTQASAELRWGRRRSRCRRTSPQDLAGFARIRGLDRGAASSKWS
jgi:hypothetical protein